jgi:hypothetical protein
MSEYGTNSTCRPLRMYVRKGEGDNVTNGVLQADLLPPQKNLA